MLSKEEKTIYECVQEMGMQIIKLKGKVETLQLRLQMAHDTINAQRKSHVEEIKRPKEEPPEPSEADEWPGHYTVPY